MTDVRSVHWLQEMMLECIRFKLLRVRALLGEHELELLAFLDNELSFGLGTNANPVDAFGGRQSSIRSIAISNPCAWRLLRRDPEQFETVRPLDRIHDPTGHASAPSSTSSICHGLPGGLDASDPCPSSDRCVGTAIAQDASVLVRGNATDEEKLEALMFLGHWVGDIRQPMHVGFRDDGGGNRFSAASSEAAPATTTTSRTISTRRWS